MKLSHLQNMKLVIFDFDGTIADTSSGIFDSHRFALNIIGRSIPSDDELRMVIGRNLLDTYINTFGLDEAYAREAVRIYRERYAEVGIHKATLYKGVKETLQGLKEQGYMIGVATLKAENFAKHMVQELNIGKYFDEICGMDTNDRFDKAGLVMKCCELCGCDNNEAILVGDSNNDLLGAQEADVGFVGVTYGFGFRKGEKHRFRTIDTPLELLDLIKDKI